MRRAAAWLASWTVLFALWLLLTFHPVVSELVTGALGAALGATAAELVRSQGLVRFGPEPRWLLRAWRVPKEMVSDTAIVFGALWRHLFGGERVQGAWRAVPFAYGGDDARAAARRALVTTAISATPNTYVVGMDKENDLMLVHQLVPAPREEATESVTGWL
jgi:multisubunit Na+/H+ antiporter MnhE subunit